MSLKNIHSSTIPVVAAESATLRLEAERKIIVALLHLGMQCSLPDPEPRPSMRVVKQVIQELQRSTVEEATTY
jgi:hypothetical protein